MAWILSISKTKIVTSIVGRLVLAVTSYFVWQERNNRLFGKGERRVQRLCDTITEVVRLKLSSIQFKSTSREERMRKTCKLECIGAT